MLFTRLIWVALGAAILVGSVQTALQQWQAVPIILAAEVFEDQKAAQEAASAKQAAPAAVQAHAHSQAPGVAPHDHGDRASQEAAEWKPADGMERAAWTWAANVLHGFSMALLVFAVMSLWVWRRGTPARPVLLGLAVAAAGWLTFHLWPSLGLRAEIPGMEAAALDARQGWWTLAAASAALACAVTAFADKPWRWLVAAALLALPFVVGAPEFQGDPLPGFSAGARAQLQQLGTQFILVTTWMSVVLWLSLGLACGWFSGGGCSSR
ncbi:CbtA family protein [Methylibium sp. T29]|uniref:CbtA family protein n=1 Tax=Methylibium sp. T29 TaxID=1430884 RepID=UPI0003F41DB4|nr:CbtA family protein [Methylibium sp. T29]EWS55199.1 cobalt transporter subunit CbtA (proposed) [Methylibium sp. T29]